MGVSSSAELLAAPDNLWALDKSIVNGNCTWNCLPDRRKGGFHSLSSCDDVVNDNWRKFGRDITDKMKTEEGKIRNFLSVPLEIIQGFSLITHESVHYRKTRKA